MLIRSGVTGLFMLAFVLGGCSKPPPAVLDAAKKSQNATAADQGNPKMGERVQAKVGVGKGGQKLKGHNGMLATPAKQIFIAEQKIMFMRAQQALTAFEIMNDRYPRSTEEYMQGAIKANQLTLPELPVGDRYEFDPKTHTLMVIKSVEQTP